MAVLARLQDFATPDRPEPPKPPAIEDQPGYAEGFAAGHAAASAQRAALDASLIQALEDMNFGFAEAHQALSAALAPFLQTLAERLLPETADARFKADLMEALRGAAEADLARPAVLALHPDDVAAVRAVLTGGLAERFTIRPDRRLSPHAILVETSDSATALDTGRQIAALRDILESLAQDAQGHLMLREGSAHG